MDESAVCNQHSNRMFGLGRMVGVHGRWYQGSKKPRMGRGRKGIQACNCNRLQATCAEGYNPQTKVATKFTLCTGRKTEKNDHRFLCLLQIKYTHL